MTGQHYLNDPSPGSTASSTTGSAKRLMLAGDATAGRHHLRLTRLAITMNSNGQREPPEHEKGHAQDAHGPSVTPV